MVRFLMKFETLASTLKRFSSSKIDENLVVRLLRTKLWLMHFGGQRF